MRRLSLITLSLLSALSAQISALDMAFAKETDSEVPLLGINASLQPDLFTGTLTGSIPIEVPPGRNGIQPNLVLSYASSGGNGWLGMGWKLEVGTIERQTRWGVLYQPTPAEEQAGQVYTIHLNGVATDLVQDATDPLLYHEKVKSSFLRIKKLSADGTAGWEITDTKGTKYKFGTGPSSRLQGIVGGLGTQIFRWCLERVEDRDGNYMAMTYAPPDQGQVYLSQIDYTGNGATSPTNRVKFYLEDRTDKPAMFTSYFPITTAKRLRTIAVYADLAMTQLVRAYKLTYTASGNTTSSLTTSIQQVGKDAGVDGNGVVTGGTATPPITLGWQLNAPGTLTNQGTVIPYEVWHSATPLDFNGDGRMDFMINTTHAGWYVYRSNGNGTFTHVSTPSPYSAWHSATPLDFNGDGLTDFMINTTHAGWFVYRSNGDGTFTHVSTPSPYSAWTNPTPLDYNGDGLTDFLINTTHAGWFLYRSNGDGTFTHVSTPTQFSAWHSPTPFDFNGDGRMDFMINTTNAGWFVYRSNGDGTFTHVSTPSPYSAWHSATPLDFNWDGRTDFMINTAGGGWFVYRSNGDGTFTHVSTPTQFSAWASPRLGDYNGDGRTDLMFNTTHAGWFVYRSNGDGTFTHVSTPSPYSAWHSPVVGDFNGDGKEEFLINTATAGAGWQVFLANTINGGVPDLLNALSNGMGGATTIQYVPSTQPQFQNAPGALPYPVQTVNTVTICDNWNGTSCTGIASTTVYSYQQGFHHIGQREFRGFLYANEMGPVGPNGERQITATWFHQSNGTAPQNDDPKQTQSHMMGRPIRTLVTDGANRFLSDTVTTYTADANGAAPWFNPPQQVDTSFCEGTIIASCGTSKQRRIVYTHDHATGSVTREDHHGDTSVLGDEKTVQRAFLANATDYVVNVPARETIYKGLSVASTDKLAETLFYYDGTGTGACTAAPTGSNTTVTKGKLTKVERWLSGGINPVSGMEYDATTGVLLCSRDPLGNKTTLTYDPTKTFVLTSTNQLGHVTTMVYSGVNGVAIDPATGFYGTVKSVTDPNGRVVNHKYDALGRKTETLAPDGLVTQVAYPTLAEFGQIGTQKITTTTSGALLPAALTSSTFFDGLGRTFKKESSGPNGTTLVTETQYDVKGQVFRTSLPYFKTTESVTNRWRTMTYDALGRVTQVMHPDTLSGSALTTKTCYAPFVTVTLDPTGARKRTTTDAYGRVVKIEEYGTTTSTCDTTVGTPYATTNYTYDLLGNLTKVVDTLGNRTTMRYDTLSRKLAMSDPDMSTNGTSMCGDLTALTPAASYPWYAAPCWNYQYDAAGNLIRQSDAKTQHLWFRYDGLNRRTQKDYTTQKAAGSGDVRYVYDDTVNTFNRRGRLRQMIDAATNVTFEYDALGRISKNTRVLDSTTYVTTSVYDGLGRLKEVTYPGATPKTVEYVYTGPSLDRVRDKAGSGTTIYAIYSNYTSQGQAQTITYGNGVVTTSTYADPAHPTCIPANSFKLCTLKTQKETNPLYQDFTYTFTADGNVDLIMDPINGNQDFGYDALDRLTSAIYPMDTFTYTYNQIGNILTNSWLVAGTYTYPTSGAGAVRPHAVQTAGPYSYSYDNNGNQTGITSTLGDYSSSTTFNVDNRMASAVTTFGTTTINSTFVYDGEGSRVKKIVGSTTTRYISKLYECDTTGTTTSCSRFIWAGDTRIATVAVTNGTVHYWHGDHLGSSSVITNSTGSKVQALTYTPFGGIFTNQSFTTPAVNVPYKYTGKEFDASTDFYYYESRYYDPWFGRFISPDTIVPDPHDPQSLNRYNYARNNPLIYTDPTGHFIEFFMGLGSLFGIGGGVAPGVSAFTSTSAINTAVETAALHEARRGIDSLVNNKSYSFNPYRIYLNFERALLVGPVGFEIDSLTGEHIAKAQQTRVAGYVRSGYIITATAVASLFGCGPCASALASQVSGLVSALEEGKDPSQAVVLASALAAGSYGVTQGIMSGYVLDKLIPHIGEVAAQQVTAFAGEVISSTLSGGANAAIAGTDLGRGFASGAFSGLVAGGLAVAGGGGWSSGSVTESPAHGNSAQAHKQHGR